MTPSPPRYVTWTGPEGALAAREVALGLGLDLRPPGGNPDPDCPEHADLWLVATPTRLELCAARGRLRAWSEMVDGRSAFRSRTAGRTRDLLLTAVGPPRFPGERLLDATAGLGTDSLALASIGYVVVACERHPVVAALLADGLKRARAGPSPVEAAGRIELVCADAVLWLGSAAASELPGVVYIDPMHPPRRKSALVRQELQVLQRLLGPDLDGPALVRAARSRAQRHVVVKGPPRAPPLLDDPPRRSVAGRRARFDVYGSIAG